MSNTVTVDTSEVDELTGAPHVDVVAEDSQLVTVDTVASDLDRVIEPAPPRPRRDPSPKRVPTPTAAPVPAAAPVATATPRVRTPEPAKPKKMLDGQTAFMDALRETVPRPAAPAVNPNEEPVEEEPLSQQSGTGVPEGEEEDDDDEGTEADGSSSTEEEDDEEDEERPKAAPKKRRSYTADPGAAADPHEEAAAAAEEEPEDEDAHKMRLIEESDEFKADGFLPAQVPVFSMSIEILEKIVQNQAAQASDAFGVGLIGFGWVEVIRLLVTVNKAFDPAGHILGPGKSLRLDGADEVVAKNIRRYRGPFRYIWKKIQNKKLEEYSPIITMGLITFDLLKKVHKENVRAEMRKNAAAAMHPSQASYEQAARFGVRMPPMAPGQQASYRNPSEAPASPLGHQAMVPGESTPPPVAAAAAEPFATTDATTGDDSTAARMIPVDSIVIPESDTEDAPAQAPQADDDAVVTVPIPSGSRARRGAGAGGRKRRGG